ncbi:ATP-grasp fold amidoligase family protein [Shimia sp. W99]
MSPWNTLKYFFLRKISAVEGRIDKARGYRRLKAEYAGTFGVDPNLRDPKGFSEKVQWRKVHDRNPLFPVFTDRVKCRAYFEKRLGKARAEALTTRLLWHGRNPEDIPFDRFGEGAILKGNHGSGWSRIILPGEDCDRDEIRRQCTRWVGRTYGQEVHEWGYWGAERGIVAEELIRTEEGAHISDLKCFVFDGKLRFMYLMQYGSNKCGLFDADWNRIAATFRIRTTKPFGVLGDTPAPSYLDDLIEVAEKLGEGVDMLRIDFLVAKSRFWLCEITVYPTSGIGNFDPPEFERAAGDMWTLPKVG